MFFILNNFKIKSFSNDKLGLVKRSHQYCLILLCFLALIGCQGSIEDNKKSPPNVVFIMMDDFGYGQFGVFSDSITVIKESSTVSSTDLSLLPPLPDAHKDAAVVNGPS